MATSSRIESALIASTSRASELIQRREVRCPCCSSIVATLPPPWSIEPCWRCSRPLTLVRMVRYPGLYQLRNVIDLIGSGYGIVTMLLVLSFVLSEMQPRTFAKAVTILLFVIGSLLLVDGALSVRTAIDRTWKVTRYGSRARMLGGAKIAAGGLATGLVVIGLHL